jgi:hypothetical protein
MDTTIVLALADAHPHPVVRADRHLQVPSAPEDGVPGEPRHASPGVREQVEPVQLSVMRIALQQTQFL